MGFKEKFIAEALKGTGVDPSQFISEDVELEEAKLNTRGNIINIITRIKKMSTEDLTSELSRFEKKLEKVGSFSNEQGIVNAIKKELRERGAKSEDEDVDLDDLELFEMNIGSDYPESFEKKIKKAIQFFDHIERALPSAKKALEKAVSSRKFAPQSKNAISELENIGGFAKTARRMIEKAFSGQ